jgi:hypothetical protein
MQISTSVGVAQDICRLLRFRHRKEYTAPSAPGRDFSCDRLPQRRNGGQTGRAHGTRLSAARSPSTFDKSPGHPLVGAFPLCARSATGYANSLVGNQAQPRFDRPWHTAPRRGSGFRPTILLARAAENPATGTKGDGVAGFFLWDMAMSIVKELGFSLAIAVAVVAGLRFVFLMCEWAFA